MYTRNPYYQNTHAQSHRSEYLEVTPELEELINLLDNEEDIFEIGFNLGERLKVLKEKDLDIVGGVEFDPFFGSFGQKRFNLYDHHKVLLASLQEWFDSKHKTYFTYYFLSDFDNDELREIILQKILKTAKDNNAKVFFIEKQDIPETKKVGKVQVYATSNGVKVDDRVASDTKVQSEQPTESSDSNES